MGYQEKYQVLSEKIKRVMAAVDLADVARDDIDAFLEDTDVQALDEAALRRILSKAGLNRRESARNGGAPRTAAKFPSCHPSCEQLEDRLPPSGFSFSPGIRSSDLVRFEQSDAPVARIGAVGTKLAASSRMVEIQVGEMPALRGGECGLTSATEPHVSLSADSFSSVFARTDYQLGPGFHGPGAPGEDLQDVLAWNLVSSHAGPGILESFPMQMAS